MEDYGAVVGHYSIAEFVSGVGCRLVAVLVDYQLSLLQVDHFCLW